MLTPSERGEWRRTSPFAILFFIGKQVRNYVRSIVQLAATFGALAFLARDNPYVFLAIPAGVVAIIAAAVLQYWFFRFKVEDERLLIRQGVFRKTALDLPFDRIQGINVERSLVDRVLGLVTVTLDTAGSVAAEGNLPSVNTALADQLRARVALQQQKSRSGDPKPADVPATAQRVPPAVDDAAGARDKPATRSSGQVLVRLTWGDMVRIGLANRNVLLAAAFLATLGETLDAAEETLARVFLSVQTTFTALDTAARTLFVAAAALAGLGVVAFFVIGAAFLRHHGYTLWRDGGTYRSRAGLFTQKEVVVEAAKIQQLALYENVMLRLFRRLRLRALPAGALPTAGGEMPASLNIVDVLEVPLLAPESADDLGLRALGMEAGSFSLLPDSPAFVRVSPRYIRAVALRTAVPMMAVGAVALGAALGPAAIIGSRGLLLAAGIVALACLIGWQLWRRRGYIHDGDGLASRSGLIGRKVDAFLFRKAQRVTVTQSPMQRRKGLATLEVQLASGAISVPYIDHAVARRLRDYILYKVESSPLRWH